MESFPGIFIAFTNLKDNLDTASLRRFDLKLLFDFLLPKQSLRLLHSHSNALHLTLLTEEDIRSLQQLENATPGDFANVAKQCRFQHPKTASRFLQLLIQEVRQVRLRTRLLGWMILGCRDFESVLSTPADEFLIECFEIQSGTADVVQGIREIDTLVEPVQHLHDCGAVVHAYG